MIKWLLHHESGQTDKVLHVWIFADRFQGLSIGQLHSLLDNERTEPRAQTNRVLPTEGVFKELAVFFLGICPRHQLRQLNPSIFLV
ncbi:hypothetical protein D3C81_2207280 [compost metagenome]